MLFDVLTWKLLLICTWKYLRYTNIALNRKHADSPAWQACLEECVLLSAPENNSDFIQHDHNVLVVKVSVPAIELVSGGMFVVMYATLKGDPVLATFDRLWYLPGSRKVPKKLGNVERKLKFASGAFSRGQVQREFEKMGGKTRWYFQDGACCFGR